MFQRPAGGWVQHGLRMVARKKPFQVRQPEPCPGECECRTLGAAALPTELPCSRALTGPLPCWGQQICRGQAAAQRLARRPSAPQHSSALNFPTKRPAGGRKEGGLQERQAEWADDSTAIPSDTGPSRGEKEEEEEEEGTRLWLRRSPGCAEGAARADTSSTSAPRQLGEGKGQPRQQGGKQRKPSSSPGSISTLPPAPPMEPADPLPTAWEDTTLPVSPPAV